MSVHSSYTESSLWEKQDCSFDHIDLASDQLSEADRALALKITMALLQVVDLKNANGAEKVYNPIRSGPDG